MTPDQTRALIARLRRMADATRNGKMVLLPEGSVSRLDLMERRLIAAVNRALTPGPERDGFPGGHPGMGGEDAPQSSTEGAAISRVSHGKPEDPVYANALAAYRHLEVAVNAIAELAVRLDLIDEQAKSAKYSNPGGSCIVCDRHVEGTAEDRLRRGMCHTDFMAWGRAGKPDVVEFRRRRQEAA